MAEPDRPERFEIRVTDIEEPSAGCDVRQHRSLCRGSLPGRAGRALRATAPGAPLRRQAAHVDPPGHVGRPDDDPRNSPVFVAGLEVKKITAMRSAGETGS